MKYFSTIEKLVASRWDKADKLERDKLIEIMVTFDTPAWGSYMSKAEKGKIVGSDQLLANEDEIGDSICNGIADHDGTGSPTFGPEYFRKQLEVLAEYIDDYLLK